MRLCKRWLYSGLLSWTLFFAGTPVAHAGARIVINEDVFLAFNALLQPQINLGMDPPGTAQTAFRFQPQLRRARFAFSGQVTQCINFFLQGDSPGIGLNGDWTPRYYPLDAFVELGVGSGLQIDAGILLLPFSHQGAQGAGSMLGIDFGSSTILSPPSITDAKGNVLPTTLAVWRDAGVLLRGMFGGTLFDYRLAVTGGVPKQLGGQPVNMMALPRLTGRLTVNFFDAEGGPGVAGYFTDGLYLENEGEQLISPKTVLSVAGSASWQHQAVLRGTQAVEYTAYNADIFWDIPLGDKQQSLNGQVDWYYYGAAGPGNTLPAQTLFAEIGYRWHRFEPLAAVEWVVIPHSPNSAGNSLYWRGGFNFWLVGHNANIKLDAGAKAANGGPSTFAGRIQTQVYF